MASKIKTFQDACKLLKLIPAKVLPNVTGMPKHHQAAIKAHAQLVIIAEALNMEANNGKKWKPNWKDGLWNKYYPWFDLSSGSGLRYFVFVNLFSFSDVGSRLCFKSSELAEYAGKQFIDIYTDFFIL